MLALPKNPHPLVHKTDDGAFEVACKLVVVVADDDGDVLDEEVLLAEVDFPLLLPWFAFLLMVTRGSRVTGGQRVTGVEVSQT